MRAGLKTDVHKADLNDYLASAVWLFQSMQKYGFDPDCPVPIDPDGELLNGSHRVACAISLKIGEIPVEHHKTRVWAPAWDSDWFRANGLDDEAIAGLQALLG